MKVEADATPTIWLAFQSETLSPLEITDIVNRIVKPRLQTVPGVADVQVNGDRKFSMRVWLDPDKLAAYRLTVQDVEDALRRQNLEVPAGRIESQQREFSVTPSYVMLDEKGRILSVVQSNLELEPQKLLEAVFSDVREFARGAAQNDDITAMVLRYGA